MCSLRLVSYGSFCIRLLYLIAVFCMCSSGMWFFSDSSITFRFSRLVKSILLRFSAIMLSSIFCVVALVLMSL